MRRALVFDLDDTLVVEEPAAVAAFVATARHAAAQRPGLDAVALAHAARERARELWWAAPTHPYCRRVGISSWEGLWCRFEGDDPDTRALRAWAPEYRRGAWARALADQAVEDEGLAEDLADRFGAERRGRHEVFADAGAALDRLGRAHPLALLTNGASCLQREKLAASGLARHFDVVVVAGDVGVAKPDPAVFAQVLDRLGVPPRAATMIGDSLVRDVDGARAAGLDAVWLNRHGEPRPPGRADLVEITTLAALPAAPASGGG